MTLESNHIGESKQRALYESRLISQAQEGNLMASISEPFRMVAGNHGRAPVSIIIGKQRGDYKYLHSWSIPKPAWKSSMNLDGALN